MLWWHKGKASKCLSNAQNLVAGTKLVMDCAILFWQMSVFLEQILWAGAPEGWGAQPYLPRTELSPLKLLESLSGFHHLEMCSRKFQGSSE